MYKVDKDQVIIFGMRNAFGGAKSTGFALVYDSVDSLKKFEPKYRQIRVGLLEPAKKTNRKQRKERKNRAKKVVGTAKNKPATAKK
jgi:small subunit ribosomal protein S24e